MADRGVEARRLAIDAMERIDTSGSYANLLVPALLEQSALDPRDRRFVTELVYGTTRMRRAVDHLVDRYATRSDVEPRVRAALQIGAYQLAFLRTPDHAAVDATVGATPKRARGFVNAILRKVAAGGTAETVDWPNDAIRYSYPDWILHRLHSDLGERAIPVLAAMNEPAETHVRSDGYRQDPASQEVAALVHAEAGAVVLDVCAAPGGKATAIAATGAHVIGSDLHPHRAGLVAEAARTTGTDVVAVVADGTRAPFRAGSADHVIVDAPCSGLGSLRRRPDARWRIREGDIDELVGLQLALVESAARLVRPGGQVVYSVCTLTREESIGVDRHVAELLGDVLVPDELGDPWEPWGRGGRLLPDRFRGDGMAAFSYRRR